MNSLIYDFSRSHVRKGDQALEANIKPVFSFEYDGLAYDSVSTSQYQFENELYDLTDDQITEIEAFIATVEPDPTEQLNTESRQYLAETDWYVTRKVETDVGIPTDILLARAEARLAIVGS